MAKRRAEGRSRGTNRTAPDWSERFLVALRAEGTIYHACAAAGVGRTTVYNRRDADPAFAAEMAAALEDSTDGLEREAIRRGSEGYLEPVIHQGRLMGHWVGPDGQEAVPESPGARFVPLTVRKYSDALLGNLIKWRRYGDRLALTDPEGGAIPIVTCIVAVPPTDASHDDDGARR